MTLPSREHRPAAEHWFAIGLTALLFFSILTLWVRGRWALSLLEAGIFGLGIAWAAEAALHSVRAIFHWLLLPLAAAASWGLAQLLFHTTVYRFATWNSLLYWSAILVLFFLSLQVLVEREPRSRFLRTLLYFGFAVSVLSVLQLFTSDGKVFWIFPSGYTDMVLGPFVYHNDYAAFVELLLPIALYEALRDHRRAVWYALIAAVLYASVIASASRAGATLASLEIAVVLPLAVFRGVISKRQLGWALAKVAVFVLLFTAVVGWRLLWQRLQQPDPFVYRREMTMSALQMARERPLTGFGLGNFPTAYPAYALFDIGLAVNHAHNDWAEWLADGGVPFFAMLLAVAIWSVRPALQSIWGIGVVSVFLHALVDYPTQRLGLAAWIFVLLGALAARQAEQKGRNTAITP